MMNERKGNLACPEASWLKLSNASTVCRKPYVDSYLFAVKLANLATALAVLLLNVIFTPQASTLERR